MKLEQLTKVGAGGLAGLAIVLLSFPVARQQNGIKLSGWMLLTNVILFVVALLGLAFAGFVAFWQGFPARWNSLVAKYKMHMFGADDTGEDAECVPFNVLTLDDLSPEWMRRLLGHV